MIEWIKTWGIILGLFLTILTFSFQSCMTRREINAKFETTNAKLDEASAHRNRIEDKVERLNQNHIEHLVHHNKKD
jgi:peptidoglycan hydrolase CwlO-like protein